MTQTDMGRAAGLSQSVVSAYESGRREPSFEQLRRLVAATGQTLTVTLTSPDASSGRLAHVQANRDALVAELAARGAHDVRVFGSVARGDDGPQSDIDLLVDLDPDVGLFGLAAMRTAAEGILGAPVDIAPVSSLKPDVRESALRDAIAL
jgi:predicted nucleotidyltransferase